MLRIWCFSGRNPVVHFSNGQLPRISHAIARRAALMSLAIAGALSLGACDKAGAGTENPDGGAGQGGGSTESGGSSSDGGGEGGDTTTSAARGKELFTSKCGECHDLPAPADHSASEWPTIMADMGPKADLNDADSKLVLDYILSVRGA